MAPGEIRVTILGSGDPFVRPSQGSAAVLIEVGNAERDLFFFDLGSGALKNFTGLGLPVTATTKVFLSHLHAEGARMSVMWHLAVDHDTVGSAFRDMRSQYEGPVTIAQDLTAFNITAEAVVARQAIVDQVPWPVVGPTVVTGPPMNQPPEPPAWWADALLID